MRVILAVKVALVAAALAIASGSIAAAKSVRATVPPGGCAYQKAAIANNTFCSFDCDPATNWCSQQLCTNGILTKVIPCYGNFCSAKCGG
jgi:hypothetical protein